MLGGSMKALTFLQFITIPSYTEMIEYTKCLPTESISYVDVLSVIQDVAHWYSQPFRPEMILEFKGVTMSDLNRQDVYYFEDATIRFKTKRWLIEFPNDLLITNPYPRTLDDFINDCQRAGIELEVI
jgi:hypothetical protein